MINIIKKLKNNKGPAQPHFYKSGAGFVILFAVTLSSILLAIALGVANITLQEVNFGTGARNSNDAFVAADTGAECALFYDKLAGSSFPIAGPATSISCASNTFTPSFTGTANTGSYNFVIPGLGVLGTSCTKVNVFKDKNVSPMLITITSTGYNIGDSNCNSTNSNRVERELKISSKAGIPPSPFVFSSPSLVSPGGGATATWGNIASPTISDWIGLYPTAGTADDAYIHFFWVNGCSHTRNGLTSISGSCSYTIPPNINDPIPASPGTTYELRLFTNNTYTRLATSPTFTVGDTSQSFTYTGTNQTFTIPAGVTSITIKAWGAGGGGSAADNAVYPFVTAGGGGGYATGVLLVSPGQQLTIIVGQGGGGVGNSGFTPYGGGTAAGPILYGGGGGGRSAVRLSNGTEIITAGAGGGGGYSAYNMVPAPGGGLTGEQPTATYTWDGAGGTQTAGGAGGLAEMNGSAGSQYQGGGGSGGGGGGYYGGGGGGFFSSTCVCGGGGGSSYVGGVTGGSTIAGFASTPGNVGDTNYIAGVGIGGPIGTPGWVAGSNGGNGRVVISW